MFRLKVKYVLKIFSLIHILSNFYFSKNENSSEGILCKGRNLAHDVPFSSSFHIDDIWKITQYKDFEDKCHVVIK